MVLAAPAPDMVTVVVISKPSVAVITNVPAGTMIVSAALPAGQPPTARFMLAAITAARNVHLGAAGNGSSMTLLTVIVVADASCGARASSAAATQTDDSV